MSIPGTRAFDYDQRELQKDKAARQREEQARRKALSKILGVPQRSTSFEHSWWDTICSVATLAIFGGGLMFLTPNNPSPKIEEEESAPPPVQKQAAPALNQAPAKPVNPGNVTKNLGNRGFVPVIYPVVDNKKPGMSRS